MNYVSKKTKNICGLELYIKIVSLKNHLICGTFLVRGPTLWRLFMCSLPLLVDPGYASDSKMYRKRARKIFIC
jgi:hypothetical protein